ncbi:GspH/FimT family pseudopilin [Paraglaciecola polaris]|uniref:Type II secretion system protein H n=1 Tax=Paraglaciecola polaris LMG 21857 TaxID=1129793 RepID=K6ZBP1_9ALTE|nr:GspH/FimT family pseudopilin [Paraglaciecola polaris]GAC33531.1 prepilin peptidase dependent protein A [Paraglaciecola polaris LMG 21857]|tara:strand:+ start:5005 stop:5523 length:519 start_codon:yes stop_codon:yes gene_type:complete
MKTYQGMSLLELMVVISISMILMTIGVPSLLGSKQKLRTKQAAQASYFLMQHARSSAIASGQEMFVSINSSQAWCLGLNVSEPCDCQLADSCTVFGVESRVQYIDFPVVALSQLRFGQNSSAVFDGARGIAMGNSGSVVFGSGGDELKLIVSNMGRVRLCVQAGDIREYSQC